MVMGLGTANQSALFQRSIAMPLLNLFMTFSKCQRFKNLNVDVLGVTLNCEFGGRGQDGAQARLFMETFLFRLPLLLLLPPFLEYEVDDVVVVVVGIGGGIGDPEQVHLNYCARLFEGPCLRQTDLSIVKYIAYQVRQVCCRLRCLFQVLNYTLKLGLSIGIFICIPGTSYLSMWQALQVC